MRHLPIASIFESDKWQRIDQPALPVLALREALINAICHRDYTVRNSSIALAIFNNRLEIWNNGTLPPELKLQDLKKEHDSFPRNKTIASVFRACGLVEKAGVGTLRMTEECKKLGIPEPVFGQYSGGISVVFKFKEPIGISATKQSAISGLSARQQTVLSIIKKHGSIGIKQIMLELENPPTQRMIRNDLILLKKFGLVELRGQTNKSLWIYK
jgi:ATP-dependent DNA helicase RecG